MGTMRVMGTKGDTRITWDADNAEEVASAKRTWDDLVGKKKFKGFSVNRKGDPGTELKAFDPDAEKLIIVPPMAGG